HYHILKVSIIMVQELTYSCLVGEEKLLIPIILMLIQQVILPLAHYISMQLQEIIILESCQA
ncbi:MAG: hypothetical protein M0Q14_11935, partial [Tissierellaceae bacterium]|nr:hypothetical protein [Tissierellaceae bacterium]